MQPVSPAIYPIAQGTDRRSLRQCITAHANESPEETRANLAAQLDEVIRLYATNWGERARIVVAG